MSKLELNSSNIEKQSLIKLEETIDNLDSLKYNLEDLDVPKGFSYATYLKEIDINLSKSLSNLKKAKSDMYDIINGFNRIDNDLSFIISRQTVPEIKDRGNLIK